MGIGIRRIAVLTSGGDAPGMNAAIRSVVRAAAKKRLEVFGVRHGFSGLIEHGIFPLSSPYVSNLINQGGTFLGTSRSGEFRTVEGREKAVAVLKSENIDALVVIGGRGSQAAAFELSKLGINVVTIPATINNDIFGTEISIGVDTALNTAVNAIDRLRTTASALDRAFLVEVMGRDCGYLALMTGIAAGADVVVIPEAPIDPHRVATELHEAYVHFQHCAIAVVAEGAPQNAAAIAQYISEQHEMVGFEVRTITLGHIQRGGEPLAFDRVLASRLGTAAVDAVDAEHFGVMVGWQKYECIETPLADVISNTKQLDPRLLAIEAELAK